MTEVCLPAATISEPRERSNRRPRLLTAIFMVTFASILCRYAGAKELNDVRSDKVTLMLEAINEIRSARDITLDCKTYVDAYLGHSKTIKYYIELFQAYGIRAERKYLNSKYFTAFDIGYPILKNVKNSRFGKQDVVLVIFITEDASVRAPIKRCSAILKAAPGYL
jgi:hypothetical protein